jgi:LacI family transcriptional regulator
MARGDSGERGGERRVTIHDVARQAGVSVATVSRVINQQAGVGADTRARLEKLFADIGYSVNGSAQQLASGRSRLIGVVFPVQISQIVLHPVYPGLLGAIGDAAAERGHAVLLATSSGDLDQTVDVLSRHRVDGVILPAAGPNDPLLPALTGLDASTVLIGHRTDDRRFRWVDSDHDVAAYTLTRDLIEQGRTRLLHLGGPKDVSACVLRARGFHRAVREAGDAIEWSRVESIGFDSAQAQVRARAALEDPEGAPDAVVCGSDFIGAGVLAAARDLGIDVPRALAVTGFDNLELAAHTNPTLTSVAMPLRALGAAAVALLLDDAERDSGHSVLLKTEIIHRQSTGPVLARTPLRTPTRPRPAPKKRDRKQP